MLQRKIFQELIKWKKSLIYKKKALVIKGLRQIGKTTTVLDFCKKNYTNVFYFNFLDNPNLKNIFNGDLNINTLIKKISVYFPMLKLEANKTVFVFDEVQECNNARYSVKPLMLDGRFDVIETGSLLGLRGYNSSNVMIPTGFEHIITMHPLDFEEFLRARGIDNELINEIKLKFHTLKQVDPFINNMLMNYFKEYLIVGGMPDAVVSFLNTFDYSNVFEIQHDILEQYKDDFGKHLDDNENQRIDNIMLSKLLRIYDSIPNQLAKQNKKFAYSQIDKNGSERKYGSAIKWLEDFGLIKICYNLNSLELPLLGNKMSDQFKIYVADTGLFVAMLGRDTAKHILNDDLQIYKGAIFENVIADAFVKNNKNLFYFSKTSGLEIDFVTEINGQLTVIEVKSNDGRAKSLKEVLTNKSKYKVTSNYKLVNGNIGNDGLIQTIPLYMAFLIKNNAFLNGYTS